MINFREWLLLTEAEHQYSSTQVNLPKKEASRILNWNHAHIPSSVLYPGEGRETEPHITVLFGLHADTPEDVREICKKFGEIKVKLGKISKFTSEKYDVLKIDIDSPDLHRLNKKLTTLPHTSNYAYKPHLTLAYVKKGECADLIGDKEFSGIEIIFDRILFSDKSREKTGINLI